MRTVDLSVIVPVLNEEEHLPHLLNQMADLPVSEILIVDGDSQDQTPAILKSWAMENSSPHNTTAKMLFLNAPRGRGSQMNAGANVATGDILLFLHVDSTLPFPASPWRDEILKAMQTPGVVGGAFRLKIDSPSLFLKLVSKAANIRSALFGLPYGDQGIFVRRNLFIRMNGYRDWPLMEDVDFIRRLKRRGRMILLESVLITSARRWDKGKVTRWLKNVTLLTLYFMGVCPTRLARWYA